MGREYFVIKVMIWEWVNILTQIPISYLLGFREIQSQFYFEQTFSTSGIDLKISHSDWYVAFLSFSTIAALCLPAFARQAY